MIQVSQRERRVLIAGAAALAAFILFQFVLTPLNNARREAKRLLETRQAELTEMNRMAAQYRAMGEKIHRAASQIGAKNTTFSLFAFVDRLSDRTGLKDHVAYMKPSTIDIKDNPLKLSLVEMKIESVPLKPLTRFLQSVETARERIFIRRISLIKSGKTGAYLDALIEIGTFEQ